MFRTTPHSGPQGTWPQSPANYLDLARQTRRLSALAAISSGTALVNLPNAALQASQLVVSGNLFPMLGAERVGTEHVAEALRYRAEPALALRALGV